MHKKKEALKIYVTNNIDRIYRFAFSYVKNVEDAEDVVNESVKKALTAITTLEKNEYMGTWFYRIIINTANTYLKTKSKIVWLDDSIEESLVTEDIYQDTDLYNQVMKLETKYRIIIVLKYYEDKTIEQIADILKENVNTVKTRLYRALDKLKIELDKGGELDEEIHV